MTASPATRAERGRFDWRRFFSLAERLQQEDDEAALRSAISRSYYAAYGVARRRLQDQGCWAAGRNPHTRVWATYRDADDGECQRVGHLGFNLLDRRRRADYEDRLGGRPDRQAAQSLRVTRQIFELLDGRDPAESCCPPAPAPPVASPP